MRIVVVTDFHPSSLGGIQVSTAAQVAALRAHGHEVHLISAPVAGGGGGADDVVVLEEARLPSRIARAVSKVDQYSFVAPSKANHELVRGALRRRGPFDVMHVHSDFGVGMTGVRVARELGIPVVQSMHSREDTFFDDISPLPTLTTYLISSYHRRYIDYPPRVSAPGDTRSGSYSWHMMQAQADAADHVISPTDHFADRLRAHGVSKPVTTVSNGVDDEMVRSARAAVAARAPDERDPGSALRLVFCGRVSAEKRVMQLVESVLAAPGVTLDIYGEGELERPIEAKARDIAPDRIRLHGRVSAEQSLIAMACADALVFNSHQFDTQGVVLLEATAMGTPVVYCDPDAAESLPPDGGIRTVDHTPEALTHTLNTLVREPAQLAERRRIVAAHRDDRLQSRLTDRLLTVYDSVQPH